MTCIQHTGVHAHAHTHAHSNGRIWCLVLVCQWDGSPVCTTAHGQAARPRWACRSWKGSQAVTGEGIDTETYFFLCNHCALLSEAISDISIHDKCSCIHSRRMLFCCRGYFFLLQWSKPLMNWNLTFSRSFLRSNMRTINRKNLGG